MPSPRVIFHIPHASTRVPEEVRASLLLSGAELTHEIDLCTDHDTDELFAIDHPDAAALVYPVSRLVVDPERFLDDGAEPMARHGMGVIYTHALSGRRLRGAPSPQERQRLLDAYYHPHHRELERLTREALREHGQVLVIDCHSYPRRPFPFEDPNAARPDLCIGTDPFHTPDSLYQAVEDLGLRLDLTVRRDTPFAGCLVPARYYRKEPRVLAVMLELQREVYMDVSRGERLDSFTRFLRQLHDGLGQLIGAISTS